MKKFFVIGMLFSAVMVQAQTARKFTLDLTEDGKAQMVCFLPETSCGKAIVGVPGGGYSVLSNTHEGTMASDWLNQQGIAYFVVNYRLPEGDRMKPMSDVMNGIRTVRDSAKVWGINPNDVGIMGFSAGGHLASVVSTHADFDARPNFSILFYPVISMDQRVSHKWSCINFLGEEGLKDPALVRDFSTMNAVRRHLTPPALIISASDDRLVPFVTNGLEYYKAMRLAGNDCAMYVYPTGDHGFGFGPWFKYHDQLLTDIGNWLKAHQAPKEDAVRVACIGNSITDGHGIDMATAYGYPALLQKKLGSDYWVKNFGVSARTMLNKGDYPYMNELAWKDALAFKPDIVVIKLGTNDSKGRNWLFGAEFRQDLEQMITTLRPDLLQPAKKKGKKAAATVPAKPQIFLCTPIKAEKTTWDINDSIIVNGVIPVQQEVAKKYGLNVIDLHTLFEGGEKLMMTDGIHPNGQGADKMAQIIADALKQ
ncbi:acetylxylan esterase AxeA1 [Prevotella sp. FD3004]|jgi:acetyl esterase/lipase|uniref:acetylxylan esterase AxeA1 n=1 Tax=Prevotella sp. FD3004 TaxID=1408309 RepID=UPI0005642524|nr:acetylxylan esterase AxeA1 [Prevotella sp. FD3004]